MTWKPFPIEYAQQFSAQLKQLWRSYPWFTTTSFCHSHIFTKGVLWRPHIYNAHFYTTIAPKGELLFSSVEQLRELSSCHHISKKIVWKYYYSTISIWSPTNSGVKSQYYVYTFVGGSAPTDLFVSKKPKI